MPGHLLVNPASSGPLILLNISLEMIINSQNIWRRIVHWIFNKISPSNIFWKFYLLEKYHQNSQAAPCFGGYRQNWVKGLKGLIFFMAQYSLLLYIVVLAIKRWQHLISIILVKYTTCRWQHLPELTTWFTQEYTSLQDASKIIDTADLSCLYT